MPTSNRTTIQAVIDELGNKLRTNLVVDPPTASKPFRRVVVGSAGVEEYARPFLVLQLSRVRPVGAMDDDKRLEVTMTLRAVTDVTKEDPHEVLLPMVGAVDDYLDGLIDTGVIEGADGFDDRVWTFDYPRASAGARVASASAAQSFVVTVERGQNRVPAP